MEFPSGAPSGKTPARYFARRDGSGVRKRVLTIAGIALAATLVSSVVESTRSVVQDWDCPPAPLSCARDVVVVGFPFPYIYDYHGLSPVGSADLMGVLLDMDHFHWMPFAGNFALYSLLAGLIVLAGARARSLRKR